MTTRDDMKDLAKDLGCAPNPQQRMVEIDRGTWEEMEPIAKRGHTSMKVMVNSILNSWLGKV